MRTIDAIALQVNDEIANDEDAPDTTHFLRVIDLGLRGGIVWVRVLDADVPAPRPFKLGLGPTTEVTVRNR